MLDVPTSGFVHRDERSSWGRRRWRLHEILEVGSHNDVASIAFDVAMVALILANVVAFAAQTVPAIDARYGEALEAFNVVSVAIFTLEYAARLWVCVDLPPYRHLPKWRARLQFAATPLLVIDLLAILPFYLAPVLPVDLRVLRVLRLLRFLKIARYSPALQTLLRVVRREAWALFGALIIMMTLILLSASILYFLEREAQPEKFGSVPASMWWAVTTLTTIGFGDVVPVTPAGKLAASVFMMFGFAMFALPVGILSSGFAREISRREFAITWHMIMRVPLFRELSPAEQAHIMDLLQSHRYPAGTIIMKPGDPADAMYFIALGEVRVDRPGEPPLILKSGDHFGEVALLEQRRRKVRVVVQKHCNLLQLGAQDFEYLMATHPDIAEHIRRIAALRGGGAWQAHDPADPDSGAPDIPHERAPVAPGADLEEEWADDPLADGPAVESVRRPADDPRRP